MSRNFPNPFNPRTTARFYVADPGPISLDIYTVAGQLVRSIRDQADAAGWQKLAWDGRNDQGTSVPSGAYLLQVRAGGRVEAVDPLSPDYAATLRGLAELLVAADAAGPTARP